MLLETAEALVGSASMSMPSVAPVTPADADATPPKPLTILPAVEMAKTSWKLMHCGALSESLTLAGKAEKGDCVMEAVVEEDGVLDAVSDAEGESVAVLEDVDAAVPVPLGERPCESDAVLVAVTLELGVPV